MVSVCSVFVYEYAYACILCVYRHTLFDSIVTPHAKHMNEACFRLLILLSSSHAMHAEC